MARILCVWELGSDLGHLSHLRLPIEVALALGHEVCLAARQLDRIASVLGDLPITCLQAPFKQNAQAADQSAVPSYTHLMARQCFSGVDELRSYLRAWRSLFDLVQPDLVLFEHSPTALIAARSYGFRKVLVGNGFAIPPLPVEASAPFAPFATTPRTPEVLAGLHSDDDVLLTVINRSLEGLGAAPLSALREIYAQADAQFLMTLPVLDHFGQRPGQRYLGVEPLKSRVVPQWPAVAGPKVFGYLNVIPSLERLLQDLRSAGVCALLHVRGLPPALRDDYTSAHLHFTDQLLDLSAVAAQAAWVVNHGNHSTLACFVRAGIPQLLIPLHQEHLFAAMNLVAQGGAVMAYQDQNGFMKEIALLNSDPQIRRCAAQVRAQCPAPESLDAEGFIRQTLQALLG